MSFPEIIGLLGILIAFFVVIFFTYKGFHLAYVVMVACIIVLVTNNMPLMESFSQTIMPKVGEQAATTRAAVENIAYLAALIAVNLAVMNLLPLPALDGGKIFFLVINAVSMQLFKKQIPAKYENYIHFAGLILLLALMAVITFSDVWKLIH